MDVDPKVPSTITAFPPGYIDKDHELIVGLQTDAPLKRAIKPKGGIGMVKAALESYGFKPDAEVCACVCAWGGGRAAASCSCCCQTCYTHVMQCAD
jgi:pyruvate-formate lyase